MAERKVFLTADEVMEHLHVGRTFVYEQARLYLTTGGAEGQPCRRFGRLLRFPLDEIDAHTVPAGPATVALDTRRPPKPSSTPRPGNASRGATGTDQSTLPFTS